MSTVSDHVLYLLHHLPQLSSSRSQRKCIVDFCSIREIASCSTAAVWQDSRSTKVPSRSTVTVFIAVRVIATKTCMRPIYTVTRLRSARRSGRLRGLLPVIVQVSLDHLEVAV
jgi:hypothetical protein